MLGFRIVQPGVYEIWGRVSVDEDRPTGSDSMFVSLDEGAEDVWDFFEEDPVYRGWAWDRISLRCGGTSTCIAAIRGWSTSVKEIIP